jgi:hypothetical protein
MPLELTLKSGQRWYLSSEPGPRTGSETWGACMLASAEQLPLEIAQAAARAGIEGRCPTIAVAAPNAEAVHDYIDGLLELNGALDVITTFNTGPEAIDDAAAMLATGMAGEGRVYVFTDVPAAVEAALRRMDLLP